MGRSDKFGWEKDAKRAKKRAARQAQQNVPAYSIFEPIRFGKYRGTPLRDVPHEYLDWLFRNASGISPSLRHAIAVILNTELPEIKDGKRENRRKPKRNHEKVVSVAQPATANQQIIRSSGWITGEDYVPFTGDLLELPFDGPYVEDQ